MALWLEPFKVSYHPINFGGLGNCGDVTVLVCRVMLRDYKVKVSCNFKGRSQSK